MMTENFERLAGPRVPSTEWRAHRFRYLAPTALFLLAAGLGVEESLLLSLCWWPGFQ